MDSEKKLTLELLAPYLPYDLKFYCVSIESVLSLHYLTKNTFNLISDDLNCSFLDDEEIFFNESNSYSNDFKPILRPMSDFNGSGADEEIFATGNYYTSVKLNAANDLPYWEVVILLKHHFDVFALIEKGLAIDIKVIKK